MAIEEEKYYYIEEEETNTTDVKLTFFAKYFPSWYLINLCRLSYLFVNVKKDKLNEYKNNPDNLSALAF